MKMNKIYGLCAVQLVGVGVQLMNRVAGSIIVFLSVIGIILFVAREDMERRKYKTCPKCKTQILKKARICPKCGNQYMQAVSAEALMEMIEQRCVEEEERTSEMIDCDFEEIEEVAVDTFTSFDGDIQEFLEKKDSQENILTVN